MAASYTIIPAPPFCVDEAYSETSPDATGKAIVLDADSQPIPGYNQFSYLADLTAVDYKITVNGVDEEWGIGVYDAVRDILIRQLIQWSISGVGTAIDLPNTVPNTAPVAPIARGAVTLNMGQMLFNEMGFVASNASQFNAFLQDAEAVLKLPNGLAVQKSGEVAGFVISNEKIKYLAPTGKVAFWAGYQEMIINAPVNNLTYTPIEMRHLIIMEAPNFIAARLANGKLYFNSTFGATPAYIAGIKATLVSKGATVLTNEELFRLVGAQPRAGIAVEVGTLVAAAPITRIGLASQFIQAVSTYGTLLQAGMIVVAILDGITDSLKTRLVQGRLQLNTTVSTTDADRQDIGSTVYYVPINQQEPRESRITLFTPLAPALPFSNQSRIHWPIAAANGRCPSLKLTGPSPVPFDFDFVRIGAQTSAVLEVAPADIFMCWPVSPPPKESPQNPNPGTVSYLPRLFYLNWYSKTSRNNGQPLGPNRRGFDLVNTDPLTYPGNVNGLKSMGLCLNAQTVANGGFIIEKATGPRMADPRYYPYLGTVIMQGSKFTACLPGLRLLWNHYNRLPYNDFAPMIPELIRFNREATSGFKARFSDVYNYTSHKFVDPTDGSNVLPGISNQAIGRFSTTIIGPISVRIQQKSDDVFCFEGTGTAIAYRQGLLNCMPLNVEMTNLRLPEGSQGPGLHEIVCYQGLDQAADCTKKRYTFINSRFGDYWWSQDIGFSPDANSFGEPNVALAPADCTNKTRGFGFIGSC